MPEAMTEAGDHAARRRRWASARRVAALVAVDPTGLGGAVAKARPGPALDRWLADLTRHAGGAVHKMRSTVPDDRLLGGLDLAASLAAGRPLLEPGILMRADGGLVLVTGAERMDPPTAARIAAALDLGAVRVARDGCDVTRPARIGVVAVDEGTDETLPAVLVDRLAFRVDLDGLPLAVTGGADDSGRDDARWSEAKEIAAARRRVAGVTVPDAIVAALCTAAGELGIGAPRPLLLAVRAARAIAAVDGKDEVDAAAAREAAALVLAPRARSLPAAEDRADEAADRDVDTGRSQAESPRDDGDRDGEQAAGEALAETLAETVIDAVRAAVPEALIEELAAGRRSERAAAGGRSQAVARSLHRGRQVGTLPGVPCGGARLDLLATLRAAAPWQKLRGSPETPAGTAGARPIAVRASDFRIRRHEAAQGTLTIFVVDASGSAALHRLGEAKGAVEMLLADCYVRRDSVALIAFKGLASTIELPPTRSLTRAKRMLAGLPGGGGTPLAHALVAAQRLADDAGQRGSTAAIVLLTDCRANVALDGRGGRAAAEADAIAVARRLALRGHGILLIDTAPRPHPFAAALGVALGARRLTLPHAAAPGIVAGAARAMRRPYPAAVAGL